MSSSTLILFFTLSILLINITTTTATSSSPLIEKACSTTRKNFSLKLCKQVLQSQPKVVSAKNLFDLSVAIIESGISKSTETLTYMEGLLKKSGMDPNLKNAIQDCRAAYKVVIGSLNSSLSEIQMKEYQTATYDLLIASTDDIQTCASKGIKDKIISSGNNVVPIFGLSAMEVVEIMSQ